MASAHVVAPASDAYRRDGHQATSPWAAHARACVDGDWLVVLDLRGDRYWALPRPRIVWRRWRSVLRTRMVSWRHVQSPDAAAVSRRHGNRHGPRASPFIDAAIWADVHRAQRSGSTAPSLGSASAVARIQPMLDTRRKPLTELCV
jgi:hypothetical protein